MSMSVDINPQTKTVTATRSLRASGSSTVLTIPPEVLQSLGWDEGEELRLVADWGDEEITLKPA